MRSLFGKTWEEQLWTLAAIAGLVGLLTCCAPGTNGLRQACANTDELLTSSYNLAASWYHADQARIRDKATTDKAQAEAMLEADEKIASKVLGSLDAAVSSKRAICDLIPAIDAGMKKNVPSLILSLLQIASDVRSAVAALQGVL